MLVIIRLNQKPEKPDASFVVYIDDSFLCSLRGEGFQC